MNNPYERAAREVKAERLVHAIESAGITAEMMSYADEDGWAKAAEGAGVHLPSEKTRALVMQMLAAREKEASCRK